MTTPETIPWAPARYIQLIKEAKRELWEASAKVVRLQVGLQEAIADFYNAGKPALDWVHSELLVMVDQPCPASPTDVCVYRDQGRNPVCIFCGQPIVSEPVLPSLEKDEENEDCDP